MVHPTIEDVTEVKLLDSGYVHVTSPSGWAQMPRETWLAGRPGEVIPAEYTFNSAWIRLRKGLDMTEQAILPIGTVLLRTGGKATAKKLLGLVQKSGQTMWQFSDHPPVPVLKGSLYTLDDVDVCTGEKETNPVILKMLHEYVEAQRRAFKKSCGK